MWTDFYDRHAAQRLQALRSRGRALKARSSRLRDLAFLVRLSRCCLWLQFLAGYALVHEPWRPDDAYILAGTIFALGLCLYGGLYALNDARDAAADRLSPRKRGRPVAAGRLSPTLARRVGWTLSLLGLALAAALDPRVFVLGLGFLAVNLLYTYGLKHVPWLDLVCNMITHPLRFAGGLWLGGGLAHWPLLLAWGVPALAFCALRRLHELRTAPVESRPVLRYYTQARLLRLVTACLGLLLGVWPFMRGLDFAITTAGLALALGFVGGYFYVPLVRRFAVYSWR